MQFFLPKETELSDVHHPEVWSINLENAKKTFDLDLEKSITALAH